MAITTVYAKTTWKEKVFIEGDVRGHKILVDEPEALGGTDKGANPVGLLLTALGSCQAIVASTYAKKFDVDLQGFWVELEGDIDLDGFLGKEGVKPGFQEIRYTFHIESNAPEDKIAAYKDYIERHCPVGDTLISGVRPIISKVIVEKPAVH